MSERIEALMRIIVGVVSGLILGIWKVAVYLASIFHFFYVLFTNTRSISIADFSNLWTSQVYHFVRYMTFTTNQRPFPFSDLRLIEEVDMKRVK